jgi:hypothetical protein
MLDERAQLGRDVAPAPEVQAEAGEGQARISVRISVISVTV